MALPSSGRGPSDWPGIWNSSYGEMVVNADGTGTYAYCNGKLAGSIGGSVYEGTWSQDANCSNASELSGHFKFTITAPGVFKGEWSYASTPDSINAYWDGTKIAEPPCTAKRGARADAEGCGLTRLYFKVSQSGDSIDPANGIKDSDTEISGQVLFDEELKPGKTYSGQLERATGVHLDTLKAKGSRGFSLQPGLATAATYRHSKNGAKVLDLTLEASDSVDPACTDGGELHVRITDDGRRDSVKLFKGALCRHSEAFVNRRGSRVHASLTDEAP